MTHIFSYWRSGLYRFTRFSLALKGSISRNYSGIYLLFFWQTPRINCMTLLMMNSWILRYISLLILLFLSIGQSFSWKYGCCESSTKAISWARATSVHLCRPWWCKGCILIGLASSYKFCFFIVSMLSYIDATFSLNQTKYLQRTHLMPWCILQQLLM